VLSGAALWRLFRRARGPGPGARKEGAAHVPFYARLVALLTRHTPLRPGPAQTPREFGAAARKVLAATPATAALADLPARAADLFYRVRFGGRPLDDAESRALDAQLDRLEAALRRATS
jgi:hypothetical protein